MNNTDATSEIFVLYGEIDNEVYTKASTDLRKITTAFADALKEVYEHEYNRQLSDEEIKEIIDTLEKYGFWSDVFDGFCGRIVKTDVI